MIVDTNVLIRVMQNDERATQTIQQLEEMGISLRLSAMSQFELYHSIERVADSDERRHTIEAVLDSKPIYPANETVMKKAGRIDGRLEADGRAIGIGDTIIAATALVHEESVLTETVTHFERIDGLEVETYL